jgi:hypothetical protein
MTVAIVYRWHLSLSVTATSLIKGTDPDDAKVTGQGRQHTRHVTYHRHGRSTIRTSAPDITRFHAESGDVSRRPDAQTRTLADDDVVRGVLDRLRRGTASGNQLITPVDSDVPGSGP